MRFGGIDSQHDLVALAAIIHFLSLVLFFSEDGG